MCGRQPITGLSKSWVKVVAETSPKLINFIACLKDGGLNPRLRKASKRYRALKMRRQIKNSVIILTALLGSFGQTVNGQKVYSDSLTMIHNDSIRYYKNIIVTKDSSFYINFKLGQLYLFKATNQYYGQLQISVDSLAQFYTWQYLDSSIYYLDKSIKQNKRYAPSFYFRGKAGEYLEHKDKTIIKDYTTAIKLSPTTWYYYLQRANYIAFSKPKDAIKDYDKTIELMPTDYRAYVGRASARANLQLNISVNEKKSIENDYEKALQLKCDSSSVLLSRGIIRMYQLKDYSGAISDLTTVISQYPKILRAYYERGSAYYFNKQNDLACTDFKKWKELGGGGWVWYIKESCGIDYETWMNKK